MERKTLTYFAQATKTMGKSTVKPQWSTLDLETSALVGTSKATASKIATMLESTASHWQRRKENC